MCFSWYKQPFWIYLLTTALGCRSCWPSPDGLCSCLLGHLVPPLSSLFFVVAVWFLKVKWDWLPLPVLHLYFTHGRICFSVWILFHWPFSSQTSPPSKTPSFSTCVVINFSFLLHLPFIPPSIYLSVTNRQAVRTWVVPHPSPPSNSHTRRVTLVNAQISLGFIWLSNGFKPLVS